VAVSFIGGGNRRTDFSYIVAVSFIGGGNRSTLFSYIVVVSFIGGGNQSTRRKQLTCRKSLTNFIVTV